MPVEAFIFYLIIHVVVGFFFAVAALGVFFRYEKLEELDEEIKRETTKKPVSSSGGVTEVLAMRGFEPVGTVTDSLLLDKTSKSTVYVNTEDPRIFANVYPLDHVVVQSVLESKKILQTSYKGREKKLPKPVTKRYQAVTLKTGLIPVIDRHNNELKKLVGKNQKPIEITTLEEYFDTVDWWLSQDFMVYLSWQTFLKLYGRLGFYLPIIGAVATVAALLFLVALFLSDIPIATREIIFIASSIGFMLMLAISSISVANMRRHAKRKIRGE